VTTVAEGPLATVNSWLNQNVVPAGVVTGAILAVFGVLWATFLNRRRLNWSVVYDAPINIDNQDLWTITSAQTSRPIDKPQLVILEVHNAGMLEVREDDWDSQLKFVFAGMEVMDLKVRNDDSSRRHRGRSTDGVRDRVEQQRAVDHQARAQDAKAVTTLIPGAASTIQMPKFNLNRGAGFRLLVLLNGDRHPQIPVSITSSGDLIGGRVRRSRSGRRRRVLWQTGVGAIALTTGLAVGITIANKALTPTPHCASGQLQLEGSTAFAPIATIAKNAYEQQCPNAHIAVAPVGSGNGLQQFGNALGPARELAMVDGPPESTPAGLTAKPVGVVIFAVVAHHDVAGTLTPQKVRDLFSGAAPLGDYKLVGRPAGSGTRTTFLDTVVQSNASVVSTNPCPAPDDPAPKPASCTAATTMQVLAYVNATPGAVGYAEADALPFFPAVDVVPLDGRLPTRDEALHHAYPFVATENLYRAADHSDLANDFISFLTSDGMADRLHDDGFIPCSEIGGTDVSGMCT
jgi:ABC-type phosphate transport system substrate-binding protein